MCRNRKQPTYPLAFFFFFFYVIAFFLFLFFLSLFFEFVPCSFNRFLQEKGNMLLILPSDGRFKNNYQKKENFCKMPSMPSSCVLVMGWVRWEPEKRGGLDRRREMVKEHRGFGDLGGRQPAATNGGHNWQ